jgi:lipopolysaccharide/colanic/teichoic acid biosynthesis glycosyltransferase
MINRFYDFTASIIGLIILSPAFLTLAILIRLHSGPPVIFRQRRVGKDGHEFELLKFRTMAISSEAEMGEFTPGDHGRVTSFGRFLRRTKLDELPQLFNVLKGDMSLVGPRPEVKKWVNVYPERWAAIHKVRPGITDPASLIYRKEEELLASSQEPEKAYREEILPRKLSLYEEYIRKRNYFMDFSIIIKTILYVFKS